MDLTNLTGHELLDLLKKGEVVPEEAAAAYYARIRERDGHIRAYLTLCEDRAMDRARTLRDADRGLPLYGLPIAIKDNMCLEGVETTCGSKILKGFRPPYTATAVDLLERAGAVILGKANMDEFAMGSSTENSGYHATRNPWDLERTPGGSSGGSAAAVAARMAPVSLGSDTGGSIRLPAAYCGVPGMKPTYGRVSRYGLVAYASSLDQIGPFGRDVEDLAAVMNVIAAHDPKDSTSLISEAPDYRAALKDGVSGLTVGVAVELMGEGINPEIVERIERCVEVLKDAGTTIKPVSLPHLKYSIPAYYLIATAEASSNLARYDGVQYGHRAKNAKDTVDMFRRTRAEGFGDEVKRRIMLGTYALSAGYYDAHYLKAQKVRTLIRKDFESAFRECDALISPVSPEPAFRMGEKLDDPLQMYLVDVCTIPANLAGLPALSVPCGLAGKLPAGCQVIGRPLDEAAVLRIGREIEKGMGTQQAPDWIAKGGPPE